MNFLEKINALYEQEAELINASLGFDNVRSTLYELKYLLAIVYYYQGSHKNLKNSVRILEEILGKNKNQFDYASTDEERESIYRYLVSGFDLLASDVNLNGPKETAIYHREKLYYSWLLVSLNSQDNEELMKLKLARLAREFFSVMDKNGDRFREIYAPFMVDNGVTE